MAWLDKAKEAAAQAAVKAQEAAAKAQVAAEKGIAQAQEQISTYQAGQATAAQANQASGLLATLGRAYYAQTRGEGSAEATSAALAAVDAFVQAGGLLDGPHFDMPDPDARTAQAPPPPPASTAGGGSGGASIPTGGFSLDDV
jgi:hypothetical protein